MDISNRLPRLVLALAMLAPAACDQPESSTSLHPEGPPEVLQVFMKEPDATGRVGTVLAFGTHPDVAMTSTHAVAKAAPLRQSMRVVFDELLLGNYLEEIECTARTGVVNCPEYSHIPEGATPDDIARCAAPDTLDSLCNGDLAVCLNPEGVPCGIRDEESPTRPADGAADDLRLIAGAVKLKCGNIEIGFDDQTSFWQPSGNQQTPAGKAPESSLGPALVLKPLNNGALPTNQTDCHLEFAPNVVDKDHIQVCTPAGGLENGACTPGDLSGFSFGTDELKATSVQPEDMSTGVSTTSPVRISLNAAVDDASLATAVTVKENGVVRPDVTVARGATADLNRIDITVPGGLVPGATYEISATPKDTFGIPAPTPITFTFTVGS
ncbi:MAG TPA: Ig-like domain-containing protein [Kofleriaceae bacterium]|nr:Ig-like domain-containing protein [Kofleriaceae bacterium]